MSERICPECGCYIGVEPSSPAELAGLVKDDAIVRFGQDKIDSAATLIRTLWRHEPGDTVEVVFWRGGKEPKMNITLGQRPQTDAV